MDLPSPSFWIKAWKNKRIGIFRGKNYIKPSDETDSGDPEKSGRKEQVDKIIKFDVKMSIIWIMKAKEERA